MQTETNNTLAITTQETGELQPSSAQAEKQFEIQSAIIVAKKYPRNEDAAFERLMKSCRRTSFAEEAIYSFPRGGQSISGPSVNVSREAARIWGNVRYGVDIIRDDDDSRLVRGWAYDLESNIRVSAEDEFKKTVFRKDKGWVKPDERDLRELTNRRAAILVRNCLLQILPKDLIEDAMDVCRLTLRQQGAQDPEGARKKIILAFSSLNITPEMLEAKLGHPIAQCSPEELSELRGIYKSISDGNSRWSDHAPAASAPTSDPVATSGTIDVKSLRPGSTPNRGHGNENPTKKEDK